MPNQSKINDPRYWAKWKASGAVIQLIKDVQGNLCAVSKESYRLMTDYSAVLGDNYKAGAEVRLIGGVEGHYNEPGYHFYPEYVTVTHSKANPPQFAGVKRSELELITD